MFAKTIFKSFKNHDMRKHLLVFLGILAIYRFLAHIPVPIGNATTLRDAVHQLISSTDFGNFLNMISGGGLTNFSILFVGISPYITSSIVFQLLSKAIPALEEMSEDGEVGRRKINQMTRLFTIPLAVLQASAYTYLLYNSVVASSTAVLAEPTIFEWVVAITAMTTGSVVLMWLGELMTEQGIGNGISTLIFASIVSSFPATFANLTASLLNTSSGSLSLFGWLNLPVNPVWFWITLAIAVGVVLIIFFLVKINEAQRIVTINYAKRVNGNSAYGDVRSIMPLKMTIAGVIPVIFATALLSIPALIGQLLLSKNADSAVGQTLISFFTAPNDSNFYTLYPLGITWKWFVYPAAYFALVFLFTYVYTSIFFNPKEIADNLQKQGGFVESVRPGLQTANYLGSIASHLNLFGALAIGFIALLPFISDYIFIVLAGSPIGLSISGTQLLIIVGVALENLRALNSKALMLTYDDYNPTKF